jgi:hypothetical protein
MIPDRLSRGHEPERRRFNVSRQCLCSEDHAECALETARVQSEVSVTWLAVRVRGAMRSGAELFVHTAHDILELFNYYQVELAS